MHTIYSASKSAVQGFTRVLAKKVGQLMSTAWFRGLRFRKIRQRTAREVAFILTMISFARRSETSARRVSFLRAGFFQGN